MLKVVERRGSTSSSRSRATSSARLSLEVNDREVVCLVGRNGGRQSDHPPRRSGLPASPRAGAHPVPGRGDPPPAHPRHGGDAGSPSSRRTAGSSRTSRWPRTSRSRPGRAREGRPGRRAHRAGLRGCPSPPEDTPDAREHDMSGGERKMLSVARALALDPAHAAAGRALRGAIAAIIPNRRAQGTRRGITHSAATRSCSPSRTSTTCPTFAHPAPT